MLVHFDSSKHLMELFTVFIVQALCWSVGLKPLYWSYLGLALRPFVGLLVSIVVKIAICSLRKLLLIINFIFHILTTLFFDYFRWFSSLKLYFLPSGHLFNFYILHFNPTIFSIVKFSFKALLFYFCDLQFLILSLF